MAWRSIDRTLYVTDSMGGSIWEGPSGSKSTPVAPWFHSRRLEPNGGLGANGIAFFDGAMYVASDDQGLILRVPVGRHGGAGTPKLLAKKSALVAADGLTFSEDGLLWVAVNGQYDAEYNLTAPPALVVVDAKGPCPPRRRRRARSTTRRPSSSVMTRRCSSPTAPT